MARDLAIVFGFCGLKKSSPAFCAEEMGLQPVACAPWIFHFFSGTIPSLENSW